MSQAVVSRVSLLLRSACKPHDSLSTRSCRHRVQRWRGGLYVRCLATKLYTSSTDPDHQAAVKRALEIAERSANAWEPKFTDFFTPPVIADVLVNLKPLANVDALAWGGYPQAERARLILAREELMLVLKDNLTEEGGVAAVSVRGNFMFDAASHRDFLGACLGTGIEREKVGDILVQGETGAQILVTPELVEHLVQTLTQVRSVPVETQAISLLSLSAPIPKVEMLRTVEASLRLDSIASAGFRVSRGKMSDFVKAGDVRVNWKPVKASATVKEGDVISCTGKGRVVVGEVSVTKKDRFAVQLTRYV